MIVSRDRSSRAAPSPDRPGAASFPSRRSISVIVTIQAIGRFTGKYTHMNNSTTTDDGYGDAEDHTGPFDETAGPAGTIFIAPRVDLADRIVRVPGHDPTTEAASPATIESIYRISPKPTPKYVSFESECVPFVAEPGPPPLMGLGLLCVTVLWWMRRRRIPSGNMILSGSPLLRRRNPRQ